MLANRWRCAVALACVAAFLLVCSSSAVSCTRNKVAPDHHKEGGGHAAAHDSGDLADAIRRDFDPDFEDYEDDEDDDDYDYNDDDVRGAGHAQHRGANFDVKERIRELFPKIDANGDGGVSMDELTAYLAGNAEHSARLQAIEDFKWTDADKDGLLSAQDLIKEELGDDDGDFGDSERALAERRRLLFKLVDKNKDQKLDFDEYLLYRHPDESTDPRVQLHLADEDVWECDGEKGADGKVDGKLSEGEFHDCLWSFIDTWVGSDVDHEEGGHARTDAEEKAQADALFKALDKDRSKFLEAKELLAVREKLHPTHAAYAAAEARGVFRQLDDNGNGKLTLGEMLADPWALYEAAVGDDENDLHDEL